MNKVTINRLEFSNMFSYGKDVSITFGSKVMQLVGENGTGKSSIPAVLEDLFYNKNSRGVKKSSLKNRHTTDNWYSAAADFSVGEDEYRLEKRTTSTTSLKLIKNGKDISGHTATQTYDIVQNILGMDFSTFTKLVYQSILSNLDFLRATDGNRKKFLVALLGLEKYSDIQTKVKNATTDIKSKLAGLDIGIKSVTANSIKAIPTAVPTILIPEYEGDFATDKEEVDTLTKEIIQITEQNREIEQNNKSRARAAEIEIPEVSAKPAGVDKSTLTAEIKRLTDRKAVLNSELKTLKAPATKCPTCGTPYNNEDHVKHIEDRIVEIKQEWDSIKPTLLSLEDKLSKYTTWEQEQAKADEAKRLKEKLEESVDSTLPQYTTDTKSLEDRKKVLQAKLLQYKTDHNAAEMHNLKVEAQNAKIEAIREQVEEAKTELSKLEEEKSNLEEYKEKLDVLNIVFGPKGLIAYKIESMTKIFETLLNEYLTLFTAGRFNLVFQVEDTKLALKVYDEGEEIEMAAVSSGEYNNINTATLLAIRKMMTSVAKADINILFLDEVISVLDKDGKNNLVDILLKEESLSTIVVSHGYTHPLADKISVVKEDGISRLVFDV